MMQPTNLAPIAGKISEAKQSLADKKYPEVVKKLDEALVLVSEKQNEAVTATAAANAMADRLNVLEPEKALLEGLVWKWRFIAWGTWFVVVGWLAARQYFPFLKLIPFIG